MKLLRILLLAITAIVFCQTVADARPLDRLRSWNQHRHHVLPLRTLPARVHAARHAK